MRKIPDIAVDFIAEHEGVKLTAYQDSVGVWTIGYGHTGPDVLPKLKITATAAKNYLRTDLQTAARRLAMLVKQEIIDELTTHQYAALLSFVFNLGAGAKWTIWKVLNARQFDRVPLEFAKFVNAGGKKLQGLVNRRAAETVLWSTAEPGSTHEEMPSSQIRAMDTPPTTADKPVTSSKTFWTGAGVAVSGIVTGAQQIQALAAPQAANSEIVAKLAGIAAALIVAGGIAIMIFRYLDARARRN